MTGSISLLVVIFFLLFVIPIALWKVGYDKILPLRTHKFSLPIEVAKFYVPYFIFFSALGYAAVMLSGSEIVWELFDIALIPDPAKNSKFSVQDYFKGGTCWFLLLLLIGSAICGLIQGYIDKGRVEDAINNSSDLYSEPIIKIIGLWGAFFNTQKLNVRIDILTTNDTLYCGRLYHFEVNGDIVSSIALTDTKRFLVPLNDIKGNDESKYPIPGRITYFYGSQIKNINIRKIEQETATELIIGRNITSEKEKKLIDNILESLANKIKSNP